MNNGDRLTGRQGRTGKQTGSQTSRQAGQVDIQINWRLADRQFDRRLADRQIDRRLAEIQAENQVEIHNSR